MIRRLRILLKTAMQMSLDAFRLTIVPEVLAALSWGISGITLSILTSLSPPNTLSPSLLTLNSQCVGVAKETKIERVILISAMTDDLNWKLISDDSERTC